ncbi:hypothetical protein DP46_6032 [Burkholderia phage BEK]|uniref:Uncharacterized protein n=1 Tax=Burkholderia phage BEK TaxID=1514988 RepID=A0A4P1QFL2_9CAUD|nr:hypothetical protein DP46_6032 [Burkholderia phage BEK]
MQVDIDVGLRITGLYISASNLPDLSAEFLIHYLLFLLRLASPFVSPRCVSFPASFFVLAPPC